MRVVAVLQICFIVLFTVIIDLGIFVENTCVVCIQFIFRIHFFVLNGSQYIDCNCELIRIICVKRHIIIGLIQHICVAIIYLDCHIIFGFDIRCQPCRHLIVDNIFVFAIPAHIRNSRDRAELNGVTDLVIADNTPFTCFIVLDLFIQRWLSALRLDSDILDNSQNVVGKNFACSYDSVLDQIITGTRNRD